MTRLNLSEWAITHRALVLFMIIMLGVAGAYSYVNLGRAEDPSFTIKTMVVNVAWPGARRRSSRQDREEIAGIPSDRVETFTAGRVSFRSTDRQTPPAKVKDLCTSPQEGRRHQRRTAGRRRRAQFQRRIRRRSFDDLHAHAPMA
jgi:hypothetical protein